MKNTLVLLSGLLFAQAAMANDGTITFNGAIAEPACTTQTNRHQTAMRCSQNGIEKMRQVKFSQHLQTLPFHLGSVSVKSHGNISAIQITYR